MFKYLWNIEILFNFWNIHSGLMWSWSHETKLANQPVMLTRVINTYIKPPCYGSPSRVTLSLCKQALSWRHFWFSRDITIEERAEKIAYWWRVCTLILASASDWLKKINFIQSEGSYASSVWNFCSFSSVLIFLKGR